MMEVNNVLNYILLQKVIKDVCVGMVYVSLVYEHVKVNIYIVWIRLLDYDDG